MTEQQKQNNNSAAGYFMIIAGASIFSLCFLDGSRVWTIFDYLKLGIGIASIALGIFRIAKSKSK